jgi:hypothetical protein
MSQAKAIALFLLTASLPFLRAQSNGAPATKTPPFQYPQPPKPAAKINAPETMHWCSQHCATWRLDEGTPFDKPHYGSVAAGNIIVVEKFGPDGVLMEREDFGTYPGKATLTGHFTSSKSVIADGIIDWTVHPCCGTGSAKFQAAWGKDIGEVPGSDQERAALAHPTVPCGPSSAAPAKEAYQHAQQAISAKKTDIGICWLRIAAKQSDANAQAVLSVFFYKGVGVPVNHAEAFQWATKAAAQNNYVGESALSQMYKEGAGTAKDPVKADYWGKKAQQDQLAAAQIAKNQQRAAQSQGALTWDQLLNSRSPSGMTGAEALGAFFRFNADNDALGRYDRMNKACNGGDGGGHNYGPCRRDDLDEMERDLKSRGLLH